MLRIEILALYARSVNGVLQYGINVLLLEVMTSRHFRWLRRKRKATCGNQKIHFALGITPTYKKLVFFAIFANGRYFQLMSSGKMILFLLNGGFSRILAFVLLIFCFNVRNDYVRVRIRATHYREFRRNMSSLQ